MRPSQVNDGADVSFSSAEGTVEPERNDWESMPSVAGPLRKYFAYTCHPMMPRTTSRNSLFKIRLQVYARPPVIHIGPAYCDTPPIGHTSRRTDPGDSARSVAAGTAMSGDERGERRGVASGARRPLRLLLPEFQCAGRRHAEGTSPEAMRSTREEPDLAVPAATLRPKPPPPYRRRHSVTPPGLSSSTMPAAAS